MSSSTTAQVAELYFDCPYCGAEAGRRCHVIGDPDKKYPLNHGLPYSHDARKKLVEESRSAPRSR